MLWLTAATAVAPGVSSAARLEVDIAPPADRVEVVPTLRPGYVWAPGYWDYRGGSHVWVAGHRIRERRGYHWAPDHWTQDGSHWRRERGHWEH
jgi:hypothetical protein